jgi:hypothetical protein
MKIFYALMAAAVLAAAPPAQAGVTVLSTGFDNVGALSGWLFVNQSSPAGTPWFQGNGGIFPAQAGGENAYAAANFLSAAQGSGAIDNWLITPQLSLPGAATLSFYTRSAGTPGFSDQLEIRYSTGGSSISDFSNLLMTVGGASAYPANWQQYVLSADPGGSVRFAFRYTGSAANADYIGLDTLVVNAVPEPGEWLMLAAGLLLIGWRTRRRAAPCSARRMVQLAALLLAGTQAATAAGQDGMVMVRDAETGAMRPATPAEFAVLRAQQVRGPLVPPQVQQRSDGTRQSRVNTRAVYSVATRGADGAISSICVQGAQAAETALHGEQHSGEHSHERR